MNIEQCVYDILFARTLRISPTSKIQKDGNFYLGTNATLGKIMSLNNLAGEICLSCDGSSNIGSIFGKFKDLYPAVSDDLLKFDICRCISDLERLGMIESIPAVNKEVN